jgi:hypothetical protein
LFKVHKAHLVVDENLLLGSLMSVIKTFNSLDAFGRVRLSKNFFMRDFLYSEISNFYGESNLPSNPELAIAAGKKLCEQLLEPLNSVFGRISIRSAFRSAHLNGIGNEKKHNCASNESNYAHHIWDHLDENHQMGATACIVIPWFLDRYNAGTDWRALAYWIHDNLPYSELEFFDGKGMCSFNISWHETPKKNITSWMKPRVLLKDGHNTKGFAEWYEDFPNYG